MKPYEKSQQAKENFAQGYNCAQAVLLAFCEETGLSREQAAKLASTFGGGMGRMREVCGAVSAMFMVEGLLQGDSKRRKERALCTCADACGSLSRKESFHYLQRAANRYGNHAWRRAGSAHEGILRASSLRMLCRRRRVFNRGSTERIRKLTKRTEGRDASCQSLRRA